MCKSGAEALREQLQRTEEPTHSIDQARCMLQVRPLWSDRATNAGLGQSGCSKGAHTKSASGALPSPQAQEDCSHTGAITAVGQDGLKRMRSLSWPGSSGQLR